MEQITAVLMEQRKFSRQNGHTRFEKNSDDIPLKLSSCKSYYRAFSLYISTSGKRYQSRQPKIPNWEKIPIEKKSFFFLFFLTISPQLSNSTADCTFLHVNQAVYLCICFVLSHFRPRKNHLVYYIYNIILRYMFSAKV